MAKMPKTLPNGQGILRCAKNVRRLWNRYPNSATTSFIRGSVHFRNGLELRVFEYLDLTDGEIFDYSYAVFRGDEKIRWYDPQPHPENPALASTFPHHRHEPPDIKHNRKPAPGISFHPPNLPTLIKDCEELGKGEQSK